MSTWRVLIGDCRESLRTLPDASVQCVVTSPPYWGLRDYGHAGQLGLERTPDEYVARMVEVFREVRRVLRDDGTLWLNLGDSYAATSRSSGASMASTLSTSPTATKTAAQRERGTWRTEIGDGLKAKDLVGIPWSVAKALQQPYYTGRIRDERDRIWLAAMVEAEGCIHIHRRPAGQKAYSSYERKDGTRTDYVRTQDTFGVMVSVDNVHLALVDKCAEIAGVGSRYVHHAGTGKQQRKQTLYRWTVTGRQARELLRELYPYFVAKQQQARIAFHCPSRGDGGRKAQEAIKALHQGQPTNVNAPVPPSLFEPGYYLRSDVIWSKLNPMPESVTDRPTKAHEYVFLLSKSERYFYDADAVAEPIATDPNAQARGSKATPLARGPREGGNGGLQAMALRMRAGEETTRNARSVWSIATQPFSGAHFATFPPELAERCILAGTSAKGCCAECGAPWERVVDKPQPPAEMRRAAPPDKMGYHTRAVSGGGGKIAAWYAENPGKTIGWIATCACNADVVPCTVLDIFGGSGTTGMVATGHGRSAILCELNPEYVHLIRERCGPMLEVA